MTAVKNKCRGHVPSQFHIFLRLNGYNKGYSSPVWNALPVYMKSLFIEMDEHESELSRQHRINYYGGDDLYGLHDTQCPSRKSKSILRDNFVVYMKNSGVFYSEFRNIDDYEYFEIDLIASDMALQLWNVINSNMRHLPYR